MVDDIKEITKPKSTNIISRSLLASLFTCSICAFLFVIMMGGWVGLDDYNRTHNIGSIFGALFTFLIAGTLPAVSIAVLLICLPIAIIGGFIIKVTAKLENRIRLAIIAVLGALVNFLMFPLIYGFKGFHLMSWGNLSWAIFGAFAAMLFDFFFYKNKDKRPKNVKPLFNILFDKNQNKDL